MALNVTATLPDNVTAGTALRALTEGAVIPVTAPHIARDRQWLVRVVTAAAVVGPPDAAASVTLVLEPVREAAPFPGGDRERTGELAVVAVSSAQSASPTLVYVDQLTIHKEAPVQNPTTPPAHVDPGPAA